MSILKDIRSVQYRLWSNDILKENIPKLQRYQSVINVSGWKDSDKEGGYYKNYFIKEVDYYVSNYPDDKEKGVSNVDDIQIDLAKLLPSELENKFDVAFNHTVLEHVINPEFAFDQISKLTKDVLITVIPWKQALHFNPGQFGDYYRISPFTMRRFYEKNNFTLLLEEYSPNYAPDTYLLYIGSKKPENHLFKHEIIDINKLNGVVGGSSLYFSIKGLIFRMLFIFYRKLKGIK